MSAPLVSTRRGRHKGTFVKAAVIGGCAAVLTACSAAISSYRRRNERNP